MSPKYKKGFQKGHKGFREKTTIGSKCEYCGKVILVAPYLLKMKKGKFCDSDCYSKWQSKNRRLEKSFTWKGGCEATYRKIAREIIDKLRIQLVCLKCNRNESIIIHHVDRNIKNNNLSNLMVLCQSCHVNLHNELMHQRKEDRARSFTCLICGKNFSVNTKTDRKVCSSECSYEFNRRGLHWGNREC